MAKSKWTTKEGIDVKVGQIWRDLDKRMGDRYVSVVDRDTRQNFRGAEAFAICQRCTMDGRLIHAYSPTKIAIRRMHKTSTGWALVKEA